MCIDILYAVKEAKELPLPPVIHSSSFLVGIQQRSGGVAVLCLNVSSWDGKRLLGPLSYVQYAPMIMIDGLLQVHIYER